ncbi:hypothetical protein I3U60_05230 [Mycobacteroides abscessus subsp. massiliense]|uniref:hypothetical protein n=1 Tax=Mycobacteroides abscessus TaxID=36809 RepID=UPI0019CFCD64|nr:hypothetical protein [Mycobacteroides abscessus]MBN7375683.1 hypothetical protein [Mycobacteroides abscessus subsp. massiliense]
MKTTIPELKAEGLHPDHVAPLQAALANARVLLEDGADRRPTKEAAGNVTPEGQQAGSPWETETSWVSPHHQKKGQK